MTDTEMQALRVAAEKAMAPQSAYAMWRDDEPLDKFRNIAMPDVVLELLNCLQAAEYRAHVMHEALEGIANATGLGLLPASIQQRATMALFAMRKTQ